MKAPYQILDAEQRSQDWYSARAGLVTASRASDVLAFSKKDGKELADRRDYRTELALERLLGRALDDGNGYQNDDMKRGIALEPEAFALYEATTGAIVRRTGFVFSVDRPIGVSPDGDVDDFTGLLEVKCPRPANHLSYLRAVNADPTWQPAAYLPQIVHGQLVTGAQWTDFVSYCPQFPPDLQLLIVRVPRDEKQIVSYELALAQFLGEIEKERAEMESLRAVAKVA